MAVTVQCPNPPCRQTVSIDPSWEGRRVRCRKCRTSFVATPTNDGVSATTDSDLTAEFTRHFDTLPAEFGRYRVVEFLGEGSMGAVYLATDNQLNRQVALKLPFFESDADSKQVERFVRESRAAAGLLHPNICMVFDAGVIQRWPFMTMALINGQSIEKILSEHSRFSQLTAVQLMRQIASAVQFAHDRSVIHRDLKPANIMMTYENEPVVMDFGLARRLDVESENGGRITQEGVLLGTPQYMAPELIDGGPSLAGPGTDVYAMGVILFELLTGRPPYEGPTLVLLSKLASGVVPSARSFRPDLDERLEALCRRAIAFDPKDRFQTAAEFGQALKLIESTLGIAMKGKSAVPDVSANDAIRVAVATLNEKRLSEDGDPIDVTSIKGANTSKPFAEKSPGGAFLRRMIRFPGDSVKWILIRSWRVLTDPERFVLAISVLAGVVITVIVGLIAAEKFIQREQSSAVLEETRSSGNNMNTGESENRNP
jgi:serine/threonine protein kinase